MSKLPFSAAGYMIGFCCIYACVFALDWPLFRYYPLHGILSWGRQNLQGVGPAITWYGLMAYAGTGAALIALIVPDSLIDKGLRNFLWLFPCAAMVICVFLLRRLFA